MPERYVVRTVRSPQFVKDAVCTASAETAAQRTA
jgi:hypothetical protein